MIIAHSQFYTSKQIASLLINCIELENVNIVLDLGAGDGSLTCAAYKTWTTAKIITADIDANNCTALLNKGFNAKHIDCLLPRLNEFLNIDFGTVDVCVCNPPYESIEHTAFIESLLEKANLYINRREKKTTTDLVFLAYNLLFLRPGGVLGIIVPYSIMAGRKFSKIRESLMDNYYLERVVELPECSFSYTEAKTGILIIRKEPKGSRKTNICTVKKDFELSNYMTPPKEQLIERLDYSFYNWRRFQKTRENTLHNEMINEIAIIRGRYTHEELKRKMHPFFHTTYFDKDNIDWTYEYDSSEKSVISRGAFLIARVGKRCVGKVKYIETGHIQISDCIYAIQVPQEYVLDFMDLFGSKEYYDFIQNNIRGVCSLYLCKCDLKAFLSQKLHEFRSKKLR